MVLKDNLSANLRDRRQAQHREHSGPFLFCTTSWSDLFSAVHLFPFCFNKIEAPVCSLVSNCIQSVECQMSLPHTHEALMGMLLRHNRVITETRNEGLKLTG